MLSMLLKTLELGNKPTNWVGSAPAPPPIMAPAPISYLGQMAGATQRTHNPLQSVNDHKPNFQRLADDVAEVEKLYQEAPADEKAGLPPQELGNVMKGLSPVIFGQRTSRALEELDQRQEDPGISRTCPSCDGPVSSSSRGGGSPHEQGGSSTSSCRRTMSEVVSTGGKWTPGSRKEEEQQHFKQLQEQEQARALAATLQAITMCLCYYAQTQRTSPTSASGFNNSTITGGVHISNTNNDVPRPKTPSGEKGDVLPHHFTRIFRSGLVWRPEIVLAALFLIYATGSLIYYQRALPEWCPVN